MADIPIINLPNTPNYDPNDFIIVEDISEGQTTKSRISAIIETNSVISVNGMQGVVTLTPDNINDSTSTNKFISSSQLNKVNLIRIDLPSNYFLNGQGNYAQMTSGSTALDTAYDNSSSGSLAINVQEAIDDLYTNGGGSGDMTKAIYDPTNISADTFDFTKLHSVPSTLVYTDSFNAFTNTNYFNEIVMLNKGTTINTAQSSDVAISLSVDSNITTEIKNNDTAGFELYKSDTSTMLLKIDPSGLKLELGSTVKEFSTDGTFADNSDNAIPTEKAIKTYVDNNGGANKPDISPEDELPGHMKIAAVSTLPTTQDENTIYFVTDGATPNPTQRIIDVSSDYTLSNADDQKILECTGTLTITLPDGLDDGIEVAINNISTGVITMTATTTLNGKGTTLITQWSSCMVYHYKNNLWRIYGDIS